jgi:hypothetical protein
MVCDCKAVLSFVFADWLVKRFDIFCSVPFCLLASPIVRGFLSVLLSTLMSDDGQDEMLSKLVRSLSTCSGAVKWQAIRNLTGETRQISYMLTWLAYGTVNES